MSKVSPVVKIFIDPTQPFAFDMASQKYLAPDLIRNVILSGACRESWKLEYDVEYKLGEVNLGLVDEIEGDGWYGRSTKKIVILDNNLEPTEEVLGQRHGEALLLNQHLIPKEWECDYRQYHFPGTIWRCRIGTNTMTICHSKGHLSFDFAVRVGHQALSAFSSLINKNALGEASQSHIRRFQKYGY